MGLAWAHSHVEACNELTRVQQRSIRRFLEGRRRQPIQYYKCFPYSNYMAETLTRWNHIESWLLQGQALPARPIHFHHVSGGVDAVVDYAPFGHASNESNSGIEWFQVPTAARFGARRLATGRQGRQSSRGMKAKCGRLVPKSAIFTFLRPQKHWTVANGSVAIGSID